MIIELEIFYLMFMILNEIGDNCRPLEINNNITSYPKTNLVWSRIDYRSLVTKLSQPFPITLTPEVSLVQSFK